MELGRDWAGPGLGRGWARLVAQKHNVNITKNMKTQKGVDRDTPAQLKYRQIIKHVYKIEMKTRLPYTFPT